MGPDSRAFTSKERHPRPEGSGQLDGDKSPNRETGYGNEYHNRLTTD